MTAAGIIAEYNPFHNGHEYHIKRTREETGADFVVVAMSGNFVQRGAPAIIDKYRRTKSALLSGADLVLQIPPSYSLASAESFAEGAVSLLISTGVIQYLSFGSEAGSLSELNKVARILADEPADFKKALQKHLRSGIAFPNARSRALIDCCPQLTGITELTSSPNNILAIEYLKSLIRSRSIIKPVTIKRFGAGYNDPYTPGQSGISAKAIREAVSYGSYNESIAGYMPEESFNSIKESIEKKQVLTEDDFSEMIIYKLISERQQGYTRYLDVSDDLSDRIVNNLDKFTGFSDFCNLIKTKDKTYTRVSRALFHILLGIREKDDASYEYTSRCPYIRILGFRKSAESLVSDMKSSASVPVITGYTDAERNLYSEQLQQLKDESRIEDLYFAAQTLKSGIPSKPDMSRPLIVL
ncbi:MAG: nucleotidyltransferase family protein [Lachnospiraceae bacterium]|nr:nucleotidyltransferase family protein [Lachnospiraceae bacterium]MBP1584277.1 nucleotidyltransferase family protein [Lachnospiraceae bacterium]